MFMGGSVVTSCSLQVLLCMSGAVCSIREGNKNKQNIAGTCVQKRLHIKKPGKSSYRLPKKKKKTERPPREFQCSDRA